MSGALLLVHGDDGFRIEAELSGFAVAIAATGRSDVLPERTPDEAAIDRARLEAASVGMFGAQLVVLHQPMRAAGRSAAAEERLLALVAELPDGAALALAEERSSRDVAKPPALLRRLETAVREHGGRVVERLAPRRGELRGWIGAHAADLGIRIEPRAAALLADRVGGAVWESDIERGEQTRLADAELRKLAIAAGDRAIRTEEVEALTADTRPASVFAITNALDRREPAAAAEALRRALAEGQPVLRIMASLAGRVSDIIAARDLASRGTPPADIARRLTRGNAGVAQRLVDAGRRYRSDELEAMLIGLFEADLAIKANEIEPASAVAAWLGEHLLATRTRASAR